MESITTINGLSTMVLILINTGGAFRMLYCLFFIMSGNIQSEQQMKKRFIHTVIFLIVANSLVGLTAVAKYYWG